MSNTEQHQCPDPELVREVERRRRAGRMVPSWSVLAPERWPKMQTMEQRAALELERARRPRTRRRRRAQS